jgi:Ca2+-binding RTX toxin-like protein
LSGGAGDDLLYWARRDSGVDIVLGFGEGADRLAFDAAHFGHLPGETATLIAGRDPVAAAPNGFLYDTRTGALYFDPDGAGGAAASLLAMFQGVPVIAAADILFI